MAKLPSGTRRRKDGLLEKRFTIDGKSYSVYGATTKILAEKEQSLRNQIRDGLYTKNSSITLDKYFSEWKSNRKNVTKSNTLYIYSNYYKKHISDCLGSSRVKDIERRQVTAMQQKLSEELSSETVNVIIKVLKIILNDAIKDGIITKNVASGIKNLRTENKATEMHHRALTVDEQRLFMEEVKSSFYYNFISLMIATGMRYGEAAALTWNDVDSVNNVIHVTKTVTKDADGHLIIGSTPKTDASIRDIPMNDTIKGILKAQRQLSDILPFPTCNIFVTPNNYIIDNGIINREIRKALERLSRSGQQIEHFTSHALRDTFATRYIEQGGNMQTLKTILGHNSITMTMDLYAHVLPDTKAEEMNRIQIAI